MRIEVAHVPRRQKQHLHIVDWSNDSRIRQRESPCDLFGGRDFGFLPVYRKRSKTDRVECRSADNFDMGRPGLPEGEVIEMPTTDYVVATGMMLGEVDVQGQVLL